MVRAVVFLRKALSFEKAISIGLKPGLYRFRFDIVDLFSIGNQQTRIDNLHYCPAIGSDLDYVIIDSSIVRVTAIAKVQRGAG